MGCKLLIPLEAQRKFQAAVKTLTTRVKSDRGTTHERDEIDTRSLWVDHDELSLIGQSMQAV